MEILCKHYETDNANLGIALIFCKIDQLSDHSRKVVDDNKTRLANILEKYGFEVRIYSDFSYKQIVNTLADVSLEDHNQNDCFLAIFISDDDRLLNSDDFYSPDDIFYPFSKCECTLNNKPKLFFFYTYRTNKNINCDTLFVDATPFYNDIMEETETYIIPKTADLFTYFSTFKGDKTLYSDKTGSLLMRSLSEVFETYFIEIKDNKRKNFDVYELASAVNRKVTHNYYVENRKNQSLSEMQMMPIYASSLTKLFRLKPKN